MPVNGGKIAFCMYYPSLSIDLALETAHYYGINRSDAEHIVSGILSIVKDNWEKIAKSYGLNRTDIEDKRPAFSVCYENDL